MNVWISLIVAAIAVTVLAAIGAIGGYVPQLHFLFGVAVPYAAIVIFLAGFIYRVVKWGRAPVPFAIPTTCGQQRSLSWIKDSKLECPSTTAGVAGRMFFEVFCFRSLLRNSTSRVEDGPKITYGSTQWLWFFALVFHWSFLVVVLRHLRFFTEPVIGPVKLLETLDGFLQVGLPVVMISGFALLGAATYLFLRRLILPNVRYISLPNDYFPLFLIMGIAASGILMRYIFKVPIVDVKTLIMGIATFQPVVPAGIGFLFYLHLFLVCSLIAYFPFSKLMHMGGVWMSPTRNMTCNTREVRHINPWNPKVHTHTYEEYEDEFREKMVEAGLPVDKPLPEDASDEA
ncbi:MAG: sulfate reduction electron transfer complex DsrMKJOP subunit DsrM [Thermodesulfobacteriota bacterium]